MSRVPWSPDDPAVVDRGPAAGWTRIEGKALPPLTDGQFLEADIAEILGDVKEGSTLQLALPTVLMLSLANHAREIGLDLTLDDEMISKLAPGKNHTLLFARRIFEPHGRGTFVRGLTRLALKDDPMCVRPWALWLDYAEEHVAQLVKAAGTQYRGTGGVKAILTARTPRWVGSVSYDPVLAQARALAQRAEFKVGSDSDPRQLLSVTDAGMLVTSHVLRVDPSQVTVLPEWESDEEAFDYAEEATLPFEPLYLDFEAPGGLPVTVVHDWLPSSGAGALTMSGALVWRRHEGEMDDADYGVGSLVVAPVGWPEVMPETRRDWSRYETAGWFIFGEEMDADAVVGDQDIRTAGYIRMAMDAHPELGGRALVLSADVCAGGDADGLLGYCVLPIGTAGVRELLQVMKRDLGSADAAAEYLTSNFVLWGQAVYTLAKKALAALSITEAEEVVIADAPMEKRDRKRAEKRKWNLAQQVYIRPIRRYRDPRRRPGEESHYSHRFWVRGTVAHYPLGTRMADARPDLVTPCNRPLGSNCGLCRKVKHPPFIKGPDEAPLVLKTLVRRR